MDAHAPKTDTFRTYASWFCASVLFGAIAFLIGATFLPLYSDMILGSLVFVLAVIGGALAIFFSSEYLDEH